MAAVAIQATVNAECAMCSNHSMNSIIKNAAKMVITVNARIAEDL
jgi:hypothetical protein